MTSMPTTSNQNYCLNCKTEFTSVPTKDKEVFCAACGQSNRESKLSIVKLLKDGLANVLNLDSRLVHTFRDILFPAKLTRAYIEGRRKYYVNPARLFIFLLIGLVTLSLYFINFENQNLGVDKIYTKAEKTKLLDTYDTLLDSLGIEEGNEITDTIRKKLFYKIESSKTDTIGNDGPEIFGLGRSIQSFGISTYDAVHLTSKDIFTKYKVEDFWDKINVGQYIRLRTNPAGAFTFFIKNITWALFITVIFMSLFMKLLYWRGKYYTVEHAVLILNSHSLLFVVTIILLTLLITFGDPSTFAFGGSIGLAIIGIFIIQYLSLKKYYQQGVLKTLFKQFLINNVYLFIFTLASFAVGLISLFLY